MIDIIDTAVVRDGFAMQCWKARYGQGAWAAIGASHQEIEGVRARLDGDDMEMMPASNYLHSAIWMPYIFAPTLEDAMQILNYRLESYFGKGFHFNNQWVDVVTKVSMAISTENYARIVSGSEMNPIFPVAPADWQDLVGI